MNYVEKINKIIMPLGLTECVCSLCSERRDQAKRLIDLFEKEGKKSYCEGISVGRGLCQKKKK